MKRSNFWSIVIAFTLALAGVTDAGAHSGSVVEGVLTNKFGDPDPALASPQARRNFFVIADDGHVVPVDLSNAVLPDAGITAAMGRRVRVTASPNVRADQLPGGARFPTTTLEILDPRLQRDASPISGSRQYLTLLCKWGGTTAEPAPRSYFVTEFGNTSPGFNSFFQETSNGRANIDASSVATAWVTLPQPQSFYFPPGSPTDGTYLDNMGQACVNAAETQLGGVDFSSFEGINFMFNGAVDSCCAWGGGTQLVLDGVTRVVSATWMPYSAGSTFGWRRHSVLAHELSHSFQSNPMHSDDPQGYEYGNFWDVVSAPAGNFAACPTAADPNYGCVGQHQIANHKILMDFVAAARVKTHTVATPAATYAIERAALPPNAGGTFQYLRVDSDIPTKYWTVESRKRVGYDVNLPGDGVIIMEVITNRPPNTFGAPPDPVKGNPARLLTPTGATTAGLGGLPSLWHAGDIYFNLAANVMISVDAIDGTTGTATVSVGPATPPEYNFVATTSNVAEGAAAAVNIAVTRSVPYPTAGSVTWTTSNGTAIAGTDFGTLGNGTQKTGTLTWAAGTGGTKNITVGLAGSNIPIINDAGAIDGDKDFTITLSSPAEGTLGAQTAHAVTRLDTDSTISFASGTAVVNEIGPNIDLTINRTGSTGIAQAVTYTTTNGTAVAPGDYLTTTGTVTFAPGETSKTIAVGTAVVAAPYIRVYNDALVEGPETFTVTLSAPTNGASLGATNQSVVTILSDENGVSMVTATQPGVTETSGVINVVATRGGSVGAVDATYVFANGTAQNGTHFSGTPGTLHWNDGESGPKNIPVTITDDGAPNTARTFTVTLNGATGAALSAPMSTSVSIADNDSMVQFTAPTAVVTEGTANIVLTVARTGVVAGQTAQVSWTAADGTGVAGTDYGINGNTTPPSGTLNWAAGDAASKTITIPILNDVLVDGAQTFTVTLSAPVGPNLSIGGFSVSTVTVNDNEKSIGFVTPTYAVTEGVVPNTVTLTVMRTGAVSTAATATWTTANVTAESGKDFGVLNNLAPRTGTITWAINDAANKTIVIPILNDVIGGEGDETFTVTLTPGAGYVLGATGTATVTIHDDDIPPESAVQFSQPKYLVMENGLNAVLTVNRVDVGGGFGKAATVKYATVAGTALAASDYIAPAVATAVLNWAIGDNGAKTIMIPIVNNTIPEPTESFKVVLSAPSSGMGLGVPSEATVTIIDDDEAFPLDGAITAGFSTPGGVTKGWHVSNDPTAYEGVYSLKSDEIDDGETAGLQMFGTFVAGNVSFRVKVSSEPNFDKLTFYVDGVPQPMTWSGTTVAGWTASPAYPLTAGVHTLRWVYSKDASVSVGMDAAYIDGLVTPAFTP